MNKIKYFSIALLISFFLPWFNLFFFNVSGFEIPTSIDRLLISNYILNNEEKNPLNISYILYLIPILSIISLINDFNKKNRNKIFNEFSIGLFSCFLIIYILLENNVFFEQTFMIGFYLTSLICLIGLFLVIDKKTTKEMNNIQISKSKEDLNKKDLFNQLERLQKLNTDGVIKNDLYVSEKNNLLKKIEEINLRIENKKPLSNKEVDNYNHKKNFFLNYQTLIISSIICLLIFCFLFFKKQVNNETIAPLITSLKSDKDVYYLEILKKHLEEISKKNPEIKKVFINENGDLETQNDDEWFLSIYGLSDATVLIGNLNSDKEPETIIALINGGGGVGGNFEITENYLITKDEEVKEIDYSLINPPKNKFGYQYYITGIIDGFVIINLQFFNEGESNFANGDQIQLKCKLINNKLRVEN